MSNEALRKGSVLLQEKSEALLEELSIKEAEWSQREDRLKEEVIKGASTFVTTVLEAGWSHREGRLKEGVRGQHLCNHCIRGRVVS